MTHARHIVVWGLALATAATASQASANAFYLQEVSAKGAGRANSGETADDGLEVLWWNPAAIAGATEFEASIGATAVLPKSRFVDAGSTIARPGQPAAPVGGDTAAQSVIGKGYLPRLGIAVPLGRGVTAGIGIHAPYGLSSAYGAQDWARYSGLKSRLAIIDIQPTLAVQASEALRFGVGLNVHYADATLSNALPQVVPGLADGRLTIDGKGWDIGWSVGVQARPSADLTLGLAYKSAIRHTLEGTVTFEGLQAPLAPLNGIAPVEAGFATPSHLIAGLRYRVAKPVTVNLQAVHFGWSAFDTLDFGAPLSISSPQDYHDVWSVGAGVDLDVSSRLTLRSGVQRVNSPTRDALRDPKVPDSDRTTYGLGASWQAARKLRFDAGMTYVTLADAPLRRDEVFYAGSPAQTTVQVRGRTEGNRALTLSFGTAVTF